MPHALLALAIIVRVYTPDGAAMPADAGLVEAARVLAGVVSPHWVRCGPAAWRPACAMPLEAGELAVRFSTVPVPTGYAGRLPLGDSMIDGRRHFGVLATIYQERVLWLAHASGTDPGRLLGRAIAHEIAHLLIGSAAHADRGLMRAVWTREELERDRPADWAFTASDAAAIRHRMDGRTASRAARAAARPGDGALE